MAWNRQYAILGGDWSLFWHDAIDLLGMEYLYLKMYDDPELVDVLLQHLTDSYIAVSQRTFDAAADVMDVFFIDNDFGGQTGPLLSPAQFDRFIMPHLKRLIDLGHQYRLQVQRHCCGGYKPLNPAMIVAGLNGLHALQPCCGGMDLAKLKANYGSKILLNGAIDSHHVLISGTPESVLRQVSGRSLHSDFLACLVGAALACQAFRFSIARLSEPRIRPIRPVASAGRLKHSIRMSSR